MSFKKILLGTLVFAFCVGFSQNAQAYNFTKDLKTGSSGADVIALQDVLISGGFITGPLGVDKGYFGPITFAAVKAWQTANNILSDGKVGKYSRDVLNGVATSLIPTLTMSFESYEPFSTLDPSLVTTDIQQAIIIPDNTPTDKLPTLKWLTTNSIGFVSTIETNTPTQCGFTTQDFNNIEKASGTYKFTTPASSRVGCVFTIYTTAKNSAGASIKKGVIVKYIKAGRAITITAPGNATVGQAKVFNWTHTGLMNKVDIKITGPANENIVNVKKVSNNSSYSWNIPFNQKIGNYKIKVKDSNSDIEAVSDFTVGTLSEISITQPASTVTSFMKGEIINIRWNSSNTSNLKVELMNDSSATPKATILSSVSPSVTLGSYLIPASGTSIPAGTGYYIRVSNVSNSSIKQETHRFEIKNQGITINEISSAKLGEAKTFTWTNTGTVSNVVVKINNSAGGNVFTAKNSSGQSYISNSSKSVAWTIPRTLPTGTYTIVVSDYSNPSSNNEKTFQITTDSGITMGALEKTSYLKGETVNINWTVANFTDPVKVGLFKGNSTTPVAWIKTTLPNATRSTTYAIPTGSTLTAGTDYKIKVISTVNAVVSAETPSFEIKNQGISIPAPSDIILGQTLTFTWTNTGTIAKVNASVVNSANTPIKTWPGITNTKTLNWVVPTNTPVGKYRLIIADASNIANTETSAEFNIKTEGSIPITQPASTVTSFMKGETINIRWNSSNTSNLKVELMNDSSATPKATILSSVSPSVTLGSYLIPASGTSIPAGTGYYIRVSNVSNSSIKQETHRFEIKNPELSASLLINGAKEFTMTPTSVLPSVTWSSVGGRSYVTKMYANSASLCSNIQNGAEWTSVGYSSTGSYTMATNYASSRPNCDLTITYTVTAADGRTANDSIVIKYRNSTTQSMPTSLNRILKVGDEGTDVAVVQETLKKNGFFNGDITGFFGRLAANAVAAFQQANALEAVGEVGPRTKTLLNSLLGN